MKLFFTVLVILFAQATHAQKLTGSWQGIMDDNEFLELNIVQIGSNLCGYTWDYDLKNKQSYCKAYFTGSYSKMLDAWYIEGTSFMEKASGHLLMQLKFKIENEDGKMVLNGLCRIKPSMFFTDNDPSRFVLRQTSKSPTVITETMKECMESYKPNEKPLPKISALPKNIKPNIKKPLVTTVSKVTPSSKKATPIPRQPSVVKKPNPLPVVTKPVIKDSAIAKPVIKVNSLPSTTNGRLDKELRRIVVNDKKIKLNIYDNGTIDGDTISIYYNGRVILKNKGLTANPLIVEVELDENIALHSIVLFAENLGSIAPNTALVIFTTSDGKRYELYSSATLQQNAAIVFEYTPK